MAQILLVDDDDMFRPMLQAMLERQGHQVISAQNGDQALARHREERCDLVITDIIMPDKEGLETIRALVRENPAVRIIAMSGGGRTSAADYLSLAKRFGAAALLTKPFSGQELADAIGAVLARPDSVDVTADT